MKQLKRTDIEQIGNRIFNAYRKLPCVSSHGHISRVDPDVVLNCILGVDIQYHHLSEDGLTYGMTSTGELGVSLCDMDELFILDGKTVLIEKNMLKNPKMAGRCNFTKCHEASHHIFKMLYPNDYGSENDGTPTKVYFSRERMYSPHQPRDWEEWQADTLASYILMPEDLIRQGMFWLDMGEQINILNKKFSPYMYEKFCMLADMLGASRSALAYRMEKLGLIKENHLSNPYIVFDRINIIKED
jgi:hypothetical protein